MKKIAIVYDWVDKWGGVERLMEILHEMFPKAPLYTSIYNTDIIWAKDIPVKPSWMQKLPSFVKRSRILCLLFFPFAFESFDLSEYEAVISISSSFAKGVITRPETKHVNIMLTPPRFLWDMVDTYIPSRWMRILAAPILSRLRRWDYVAAQRPDTILAISEHVAKRVEKTYRRKAEVVYPPFDYEYWDMVEAKIESVSLDLPFAYYLVVARLEKYKKVDMVVEAFNKLPDQHLVIVGTGSEIEELKKRSNNNINFLEHITDEELVFCYKNAKALIMMQEEDFGYTAVESMYFGCPVISYKNSGAAEIMGNKGVLIDTQSVAALTTALERFAPVEYNVTVWRKHIKEQFSKELLKKELLKLLTIEPSA